MATFTSTELEKLDLKGPSGPFYSTTGKSTYTTDNIKGPTGFFYAITSGSAGVSFDTTKMFLIF